MEMQQDPMTELTQRVAELEVKLKHSQEWYDKAIRELLISVEKLEQEIDFIKEPPKPVLSAENPPKPPFCPHGHREKDCPTCNHPLSGKDPVRSFAPLKTPVPDPDNQPEFSRSAAFENDCLKKDLTETPKEG